MDCDRRKFVKGMAIASLGIPFSGAWASVGKTPGAKTYPINFFTKPLDRYGPEFMMDTLLMAGVDGLDLTVRPKGCIPPEKVETDLPKMVNMAKKKGLDVKMMVTALKDPKEPFAGKVLATAAANGIKHYRTGYYGYEKGKDIYTSIENIKGKLRALAKLNERLGIQGGYQNHSGTRFGAPMWDLWEALRGIPPEWMGCQFDIRHAVCEGNNSWAITLRLLAKKIGSLAIKDFIWNLKGKKATIKSVPLGAGQVDFEKYFALLKELEIDAPITLHAEYPLLSEQEEGLTLSQKQKTIASRLKKDVDFIKAHLVKYQLHKPYGQ